MVEYINLIVWQLCRLRRDLIGHNGGGDGGEEKNDAPKEALGLPAVVFPLKQLQEKRLSGNVGIFVSFLFICIFCHLFNIHDHLNKLSEYLRTCKEQNVIE